MGVSRYNRARLLLKSIKIKKGPLVDFQTIRLEIIKTIGSDEVRTVRPYLKLMNDMKMISPQEEGVLICNE